MTFSKYCQFKINNGEFDISLSEDEFVEKCKQRFGVCGMYTMDMNYEFGVGKADFRFEQIIDGQKVTMFAGSWKELYHLLRQQYGKEDKQLTLW